MRGQLEWPCASFDLVPQELEALSDVHYPRLSAVKLDAQFFKNHPWLH
jgi:hypothetical protein